MKKLTFAVSCYNFEKFIEECIESILNQKTNFDFDILIRDDKSTDGSKDIIKSLINKYSNLRNIRLIESENNVGVNENIRLLLSECKSQYIALLDGDDYLTDSNKLQYQVEFLDNNPDYVLHSTSYKYIDKENNIIPSDSDRWFCPIKEEVEVKDLLEKNIISFGRVFRNVDSIHKGLQSEYYKKFPYDDWALNFEILKNGKAKCEDYLSGIYRITGTGVISSDSEEKIIEKNRKCIEILNQEYNKILNENDKDFKIIAIVDSFVHKKEVEIKLIECLDRLREDGIPILLMSNTKINLEVLEKVDYYLYDKRNQLFTSGKYTGVRDINIWKANEKFEAHEIKSGLQKHGLSVLVNIFNSLNYARSLGYTHFFRFEVDDDFGIESRKFIKEVPNLVQRENKKALFYFNEGDFHNGVNNTEPNNVSFHFMYSEIDFFLNSVTKISNESDYENYLLSTKGNLDFEIAEEFIYNHLVKVDQSSIIKKNGLVGMQQDFPDTEWNKIVSESNMSDKFNGCTTLIYKIHEFPPDVSSIMNKWQGEPTDRISILSYNFRDDVKNRKIVVIFNDGRIENIIHHLSANGSWSYNNYGNDVEKILVYEDDKLLYEDITSEAKNYIVFR